MSAVLNTNVASLWASKNLLGAQEKMANSVERLSSGLRINRARDDAAGLGVANALTSQINGANQGIRNLNDGISMVQTAEAAISAASEMGQRILTLATQGANSTLGYDERKAIHAEMTKLLDAIDAIGGRTKFSDNQLLGVSTDSDATDTRYSLQVSRESSDRIDLSNAAFYDIGVGTSTIDESVEFTFDDLLDGDSITIGNLTIVADGSDIAAEDLAAIFADPGSASGDATVFGALDAGWEVASFGNTAIFYSTVEGANVDDLGNIAAPDGVITSQTYTQGSSSSGAQGSLLKEVIDELGDVLSWMEEGASWDEDVSPISSSLFNDIQDIAKQYVTDLGTQRSLLGAYQNQIEYTVSNVTELSANLSAARSRVQDTDFAAETANLTKGQILQQAATAMLAQANQMPNVILTLLK